MIRIVLKGISKGIPYVPIGVTFTHLGVLKHHSINKYPSDM